MGIPAVSDAVVNMPSGGVAALYLTDGDRGNGLGGPNGPAMAAAVVAMGRNGQRQQRQGQDAEERLFELHVR